MANSIMRDTKMKMANKMMTRRSKMKYIRIYLQQMIILMMMRKMLLSLFRRSRNLKIRYYTSQVPQMMEVLIEKVRKKFNSLLILRIWMKMVIYAYMKKDELIYI